MDHAAIYTIHLVFTDGTDSQHQVLCLGLDPVFSEADDHFLATHNTPEVTLDYLLITNDEGAVMAKWEGVALPH